MRALMLRLARLCLRLAVDQSLDRSLPRVFRRIDGELPLLMANQAPPMKVVGLIGSAIADATGRRATSQQIKAVIELYNPVAAALRNIQR